MTFLVEAITYESALRKKMNFKRTIRILTQQDQIDAGCFDVRSVVEVCRQALMAYANGDVIFPDKTSVIFDEATQDRINCLPAGFKDKKIYGMKWVSVFPQNPVVHGCPNLSAVILLSELTTGYPMAFIEGTMLSNLRTAAMSVLAARYLARKDSVEIGFIGSGEQAKSHFLGMKAEFPGIRVCRVSSGSRESVSTFVSQMQRFHPDVEFVAYNEDYRSAVEGADIVVTAISGQEPILKADWIKAGAFYCHVGGYEDEFAVAQKADKIVCDNWDVVKHRTQTISRMYKAGLLVDGDIHANLHEIVNGMRPGRENDLEFVYYNGVGLSYIDVAVAHWAFSLASCRNIGSDITMAEESMFEMMKQV